MNEATRFISPTKTPEFLAAGLPVVSTPITDVVRHYGELDGGWSRSPRTPELRRGAARPALLSGRARAWLEQVDRQAGRSCPGTRPGRRWTT